MATAQKWSEQPLLDADQIAEDAEVIVKSGSGWKRARKAALRALLGSDFPVVDWDLTPIEQPAKLSLYVPELFNGFVQRGVQIDDYAISDTYDADVFGMAMARFGDTMPTAGRHWFAVKFGAAVGSWSTVLSLAADESTGNAIATLNLNSFGGGLRIYSPSAVVIDADFVAGETAIVMFDAGTGGVSVKTPRVTWTAPAAAGALAAGLTLLLGAWAQAAEASVIASMHSRADMLPAGLTPDEGYEPLTEMSAALPSVPSVPAYLNVTVGGQYRGIDYHPTTAGTCPAAILHDDDIGIVEPLPRDAVGKHLVQQMIDGAAPGLAAAAKTLTATAIIITPDPADVTVGAGGTVTDVVKITVAHTAPEPVVRILISEDLAALPAGTELQLSFSSYISKMTLRRSSGEAGDMLVRSVSAGDCVRIRKQNGYANLWEVIESIETHADTRIATVVGDNWPAWDKAKADTVYQVDLSQCTPGAGGVVTWGGDLKVGMRICGINFIGGLRLRVGTHELWSDGHVVEVVSPGVVELRNNSGVDNGNQGQQHADQMTTPGMRLVIGGGDGSPTELPGMLIVHGGTGGAGIHVVMQTFIDWQTAQVWQRSGTEYGFTALTWGPWLSADEEFSAIWESLGNKMPASATTSNVPEGSRPYFTDARAVGAILGEAFTPVAGLSIGLNTSIVNAIQALANHATSTTYALIADLPAAAQNHGRTVYVSQARCTFFSNGATWLQGRPGGFTYAEISALDPALFAGIDLFCSDYNAAVTCNGSRFLATGPITLKRGVGGNVNNTTAESIADATLIPRKILGVKHSVSIWIRAAAPTVSSITRIRLNTTASLTGATTGHFAHATAVTTAHTVEKEIRALSDTSQVSGGGATASSNTASNSSGVATSLSTAADYYVITSFAMTALSGSAQLSSVDVKAYPGD